MKTCAVRLEEIADCDNLRNAFLKAASGHAASRQVLEFRAALEDEILALRDGILDGSIDVGHSHRFVVYEPKRRDIYAPVFRERVLHHAIVDACLPFFDRLLIDDSFAGRKGLGRDAALRHAERYAQSHRWFLKLDVAKYFDSIPHSTLLTFIAPRFRDERLARLFAKIVLSHETTSGRGLPIGTLVSQFLANLYLAPVDRLIKQSLRMPGYVRYMDDMLLFSDDKEQLKIAKKAVEVALGRLGLALNPKWHLQPMRRGADFLGYRVFPCGSVLNAASRKRFCRKAVTLQKNLDLGQICEDAARSRFLAMFSFTQKVTAHWATTGLTEAARGTTMPAGAVLPTGTGTSRTGATTTSASGLPSAPDVGAEMKQGQNRAATCSVLYSHRQIKQTESPRAGKTGGCLHSTCAEETPRSQGTTECKS